MNDRGWHIRHVDGIQTWDYEDDYNVLGYVVDVLGLDPLTDVDIDASGITVLDVNGTGIRHYYYGDNVLAWIIEQGFVTPAIAWQYDFQQSVEALDFETASNLRGDASGLLDTADAQVMLWEDGDPTVTHTEADWRAFRVALRAYIAEDDATVVSSPMPVVV
jgi:hypothetical protein